MSTTTDEWPALASKALTKFFNKFQYDSADVHVALHPKSLFDLKVRHKNAELPAAIIY